MKGKHIGFDDEVSSSSGKDVKDTKQLDATAREKNATGTNKTSRSTTKHKPFGKLGTRGHPS